MLWDQHRDRWVVGGYTARRIPYLKFVELTRDFPREDIARIGRLKAKRDSGADLTVEEQTALASIASKWPVDDLRGACLIPPVSGEAVRAILADLPRHESEDLERVLDVCIVPDIPEKDVADPLAIVLVARGALGIDIADMTAGQGMAVAGMLAPREG